MGLGKFWRDEAKREALIGLFGIGMALFGKGRRAQVIMQILSETPGRIEAFRGARAKINDMAAEIESADALRTGPLSELEIVALDDFLDLIRRPKRELRRILRDGL